MQKKFNPDYIKRSLGFRYLAQRTQALGLGDSGAWPRGLGCLAQGTWALGIGEPRTTLLQSQVLQVKPGKERHKKNFFCQQLYFTTFSEHTSMQVCDSNTACITLPKQLYQFYFVFLSKSAQRKMGKDLYKWQNGANKNRESF